MWQSLCYGYCALLFRGQNQESTSRMDKSKLLKHGLFQLIVNINSSKRKYSRENRRDFNHATLRSFNWLCGGACHQRTYPHIVPAASILATMSNPSIHGYRVVEQVRAPCICDRFVAPWLPRLTRGCISAHRLHETLIAIHGNAHAARYFIRSLISNYPNEKLWNMRDILI